MVRSPCCDKSSEKNGHWNETAIQKKHGVRRCGKSNCSRHESFTPQEEEMIVRLHAAIGSRWSIIAQQLPGRTDNDVKNCWNTKLKKKLSGMGIDPVTHKPFSQLEADYGNIGGLPKAGTQTGLKNSFVFKSDQFPNFNTHMPISVTPTLLIHQTLAEEGSNITNHEANTPHSDCSSSSSSSLAGIQVHSSINFSWRDFLLEDPFLPGDNGSSSQAKNEMLQKDSHQEEEINFGGGEDIGYKVPINGFEASSTSDSSWVEVMLDRQNDMLLEFPGLLEESFLY